MYRNIVSNEVMVDLSDCLLEVFDHFSIRMYNGGSDISWRNNNNLHIIIDIPYGNGGLRLGDIIQYLESKRDMIVKRFGYDIRIWSHIGDLPISSSCIRIRPLVPVLDLG